MRSGSRRIGGASGESRSAGSGKVVLSTPSMTRDSGEISGFQRPRTAGRIGCPSPLQFGWPFFGSGVYFGSGGLACSAPWTGRSRFYKVDPEAETPVFPLPTACISVSPSAAGHDHPAGMPRHLHESSTDLQSVPEDHRMNKRPSPRVGPFRRHRNPRRPDPPLRDRRRRPPGGAGRSPRRPSGRRRPRRPWRSPPGRSASRSRSPRRSGPPPRRARRRGR